MNENILLFFLKSINVSRYDKKFELETFAKFQGQSWRISDVRLGNWSTASLANRRETKKWSKLIFASIAKNMKFWEKNPFSLLFMKKNSNLLKNKLVVFIESRFNLVRCENSKINALKSKCCKYFVYLFSIR